MGQRRVATPQADDAKKRPHASKQPATTNTVLSATTTRKGEVFRAQRRTSEGVNAQASQHVINVPVNKSVYNGYGGKQFYSQHAAQAAPCSAPNAQGHPDWWGGRDGHW